MPNLLYKCDLSWAAYFKTYFPYACVWYPFAFNNSEIIGVVKGTAWELLNNKNMIKQNSESLQEKTFESTKVSRYTALKCNNLDWVGLKENHSWIAFMNEILRNNFGRFWIKKIVGVSILTEVRKCNRPKRLFLKLP